MATNKLGDPERYKIAARRVKQLKGFYMHSIVYILVNSVIVIINIQNLNDGESYFQWHNFISLSLWGIGLLAHAAAVFLPNLILGKNWEEREIMKFMDRETQDDKRYE